MSELLLLRRETEPLGDVACVDGNCRRMARRVPVPCVKCRHQSSREGEVRALQSLVDDAQVLSQPSLILIEPVEALCSDRWNEEEWQRPRGDALVCERQKTNQWGVERD